MYSQTTRRRSSSTGRYKRHSPHERVHSMLVTWASHVKLRNGSSEGIGYTIGFLDDYSGLPAHSLIPKGVEFTSPDDIAIEGFLYQTTDKYRELVQVGYIDGKKLGRYKQSDLLEVLSKWLFT